ncbi:MULTISPECIES: STAS domain-containing protein [unclassified Streptomyces]|uniref:STAS domain-containing protein n=1 Tax=unclassified Streptomyces TaxID=2593676 RepID=UPI00340FA43D
MFAVEVTQEERGMVFTLCGELDIDSMVQLEHAGEQALATGRGAGPVVVDCAALAFCDSSGIGALLHLRQRLIAQGRPLRLSGLPAQVTRLFTVTGLDQIFDVYPDTCGALAAGAARRDIVADGSGSPAPSGERQNS